jgi:hypothetical protein
MIELESQVYHNEITSADGGWPRVFPFLAQRPAAAGVGLFDAIGDLL